MMEKSPENMYLTHFGRVQDVAQMASRLKLAIGQFVSIAETHANDENRTELIEAGIMDWLLRGTREHGVTLSEQQIREIVQNDVVLNTQGIEFWLDHRE
jgi:hypothetical protein